MKILVTGAHGQLGKALTQQLHKRKAEFLALSHTQLDITNKENVQEVLFRFHPDLVINTAAYTAVDDAESDPQTAYTVNCDGVSNLAEAVEAIDGAIFHVSTDYVFPGTQQHHYSETDPTDPINVYGKSKLAGEIAATKARKHVILRTAWIFSEHGNNFITKLLKLGYRKSQLDVVCDQFGNPTYAADVAKTLLQIADVYDAKGDLKWGLYQYAGQPSISRFELANYLFERVTQLNLYGHTTPQLNPILTANHSSPAKRPLNTSLCCTKIQREFGIMPSDWKMALDQLSDYFDTHDCN